MDRIHFIINYLSHSLKANNEHSVHSPFIYGLYTNSIRARDNYYIFDKIEKERKLLLANHSTIAIKDFGAGAVDTSKTRKISSIANSSLVPAENAQMLFRLLRHLQVKNVLELGTSFGTTTAYLASCKSNVNVQTMEGCPQTASIAKKVFSNLGLNSIQLHLGDISNNIHKILEHTPKIDAVFFDANHTKKATLNYFDLCLNNIHNDSVFIFDDIYWSREMTQAWTIICANPKVKVSIDLFRFGLIFFRKEQAKQHYRLTTKAETHPWVV